MTSSHSGSMGIPSRVVIPILWHQRHPIQSCHSMNLVSMASHPELSFHELGVNGIPSSVVIPSTGCRWHPVQSCHSMNL
eukprot:748212-Amphidinium_carterae.1